MKEVTTDKGLKKAAGRRMQIQLPSNFSYRTMLRICEAEYLREKRREKRIFIAWAITVSLMIIGCLGYLGWMYSEQILRLWQLLKNTAPSAQHVLFHLPMVIALLLLGIFNRWLRKQFGSKS